MFYLSETQKQAAGEWVEAHRQLCKIKYAGAIGGSITWSFTYTSLGLVATIKCACKAKCDISDYDDW